MKYIDINNKKNIPITVVEESLIQDDTIKIALGLVQNADLILTSVRSIEYKTWENYLGERTFHLLGNKGGI